MVRAKIPQAYLSYFVVPLLLFVGCEQPQATPPTVAGNGTTGQQIPARESVSANKSPAATAPTASISKPPQTGQRLFDGNSLSGWRIADEADFAAHGNVSAHDGAIQLAAGDPATGIALTAPITGPLLAPLLKKNGEYELRFSAKRTAGEDFFCGLTFPVGAEHCTLIVGGWGGDVVGLSNIDGEAANENLTTTTMQFTNDRWYRIRLRVDPEKISAWIDDEQVIDLARAGHQFSIWPQQEPMRPLGIATWHTGAALIDIELIRQEKAP